MDAAEGFTKLYQEHSKSLHAFFLAHTSNKEAALDLLQELFTKVWRNYNTISTMTSESQRWWLFAVARNLVIDHNRRRASGLSSGTRINDTLDKTPISDDEPEAAFEHKEMVDRLNRAITRLPEDLRTVLIMSVVGGSTSVDIAKITGRPAGTVRYMLHKARRILATELNLPASEPLSNASKAAMKEGRWCSDERSG